MEEVWPWGRHHSGMFRYMAVPFRGMQGWRQARKIVICFHETYTPESNRQEAGHFTARQDNTEEPHIKEERELYTVTQQKGASFKLG